MHVLVSTKNILIVLDKGLSSNIIKHQKKKEQNQEHFPKCFKICCKVLKAKNRKNHKNSIFKIKNIKPGK